MSEEDAEVEGPDDAEVVSEGSSSPHSGGG